MIKRDARDKYRTLSEEEKNKKENMRRIEIKIYRNKKNKD